MLGDLRANMGQGGLIDHFKTYIIRQEDQNLQNIKKFANKTAGVINAYKALQLSDAETGAIKALETAVAAYSAEAGKFDAAVVALTEANTRIRLDLTDEKVDQIARFIASRG
ncbi:MAG: hypothetical protein VW268_11835 [Rhodospirillaceae bacterium]